MQQRQHQYVVDGNGIIPASEVARGQAHQFRVTRVDLDGTVHLQHVHEADPIDMARRAVRETSACAQTSETKLLHALAQVGLAIAVELHKTGALTAERLDSIDDALRNTVGGSPVRSRGEYE